MAIERFTVKLACPVCATEVEFAVSAPEVANAELASVLVLSHPAEVRCSQCLTKLLPVVASAQVSSNWALLPAPEEKRIVEPTAAVKVPWPA